MMGQMNKAPMKQKLSLDNHQNPSRNTLPHNFGQHRAMSTNHYAHHYHHQPHTMKPHIGHNVAKPRSRNKNRNDTETGDSFSENSENESVDEFEIDAGDDTATSVADQTTSTHPNMHRPRHKKGAPSTISTDLDTTTFFDTENDEEDDGQFSSITEQTNSTMSSRHYGLNRNRRRMRHKIANSQLKRHNSLHSSMSSMSDSTMSLNIITVTLNMGNFKHITIFSSLTLK